MTTATSNQSDISEISSPSGFIATDPSTYRARWARASDHTMPVAAHHMAAPSENLDIRPADETLALIREAVASLEPGQFAQIGKRRQVHRTTEGLFIVTRNGSKAADLDAVMTAVSLL